MTPLKTTATLMAALAASLAGVTVACDDASDAVRGSGTITTEERSVDGFREVHLEGSGDLVVEVTGEESLTIETDENLLELITTEVRGSRLVIENEEAIRPTTGITYRVTAIDFDGVSIAGSADVIAPNVDCDTFSVSVAGAGSLDLAGRCDELDVEIAGSGDLDADALAVDRAEVAIAGSGDVVINARDELRVSIAGSGDVTYVGDPTTDITISGSGDVRRSP